MFKNEFKYYKRKCPPPSYSDVLDFNVIGVDNPRFTKKVPFFNGGHADHNGLKPLKEWKIYECSRKSGLLFISNPFTPEGQRYWIRRCVQDFTKKPNKLNLDVHGGLDKGQEWWDTCRTSKDGALLQKLRWATIGYHHNWDTKQYSESSRGSFPEDLAELCRVVARTVGFKDFSPEAAIINFYHMDSTLSGHTDHSEIDKKAPLFSFSFGQSAIFLIGGTTLEEKPVALLIRSGDIIVMSGESRLCYHGVPRIIRADLCPWNDSYDKDWETFEDYITGSRINMNVRQVLKPGQTHLTDA